MYLTVSLFPISSFITRSALGGKRHTCSLNSIVKCITNFSFSQFSGEALHAKEERIKNHIPFFIYSYQKSHYCAFVFVFITR